MDRARELTDKLLQRQEEHERAEKEKMERVFAQYMQRRMKAEEYVKKLEKEEEKKVKYAKDRN